METAVRVSGLRDITPNNIESSGEENANWGLLSAYASYLWLARKEFLKKRPLQNPRNLGTIR